MDGADLLRTFLAYSAGMAISGTRSWLDADRQLYRQCPGTDHHGHVLHHRPLRNHFYGVLSLQEHATLRWYKLDDSTMQSINTTPNTCLEGHSPW